NLSTDHVTEDHEVQDHGDGRRQQGLRPAPGKALHLAVNDGVEGNEAGLQLGTHTASFDRFFSTRDSNYSSRRLVLLRRLSTSMFCCANWVNSAVMPMALSTWTSSVWLSSSLVG